MANVSPGERSTDRTRRERAQLLILIGIVLALALVSLALFLNSVIYAENVGSRGADVGGTDAAAFTETVESEGEHLLTIAFDEHDDPDDAMAAFNTSIEDWTNSAHRYTSADGVYTHVTVEEPVDVDGPSVVLRVVYDSRHIDYEGFIVVEGGNPDD